MQRSNDGASVMDIKLSLPSAGPPLAKVGQISINARLNTIQVSDASGSTRISVRISKRMKNVNAIVMNVEDRFWFDAFQEVRHDKISPISKTNLCIQTGECCSKG